MRIVVLVKHVPEPTATLRFADDLTLDRAGVDGHLCELDEYAVEQAVRLVEGGLDAEARWDPPATRAHPKASQCIGATSAADSASPPARCGGPQGR